MFCIYRLPLMFSCLCRGSCCPACSGTALANTCLGSGLERSCVHSPKAKCSPNSPYLRPLCSCAWYTPSWSVNMAVEHEHGVSYTKAVFFCRYAGMYGTAPKKHVTGVQQSLSRGSSFLGYQSASQPASHNFTGAQRLPHPGASHGQRQINNLPRGSLHQARSYLYLPRSKPSRLWDFHDHHADQSRDANRS